MFTGNIIAFSGQTIPEGYLLCDGSAVSRFEYAELFDIIGTTYGQGNGSTTFNIPNLLSKAAVCTSVSLLLGSSGGEESHELVSEETPLHTHEFSEHTHEFSFSATATLSHDITQPVATYNRINNNSSIYNGGIRTAYNSRTNKTMSRTTDLAIADHPATACTVTGGILDCPTFNTESIGGGQGHNNMMPYLAVRYLIKAGIPVPVEPGMAMYHGFMVATAGGGYITGKTA